MRWRPHITKVGVTRAAFVFAAFAALEVLCRLKYGPRGGAPFQAKTLEPLTKLLPIVHDKQATVLGRSRRHFARPRAEVEACIEHDGGK